MKTKINTKSTTLYDKLDKIVEKLDYLSNDVVDGTITANSIYDRIDRIRMDIDKIKDSL
jgi:hypothetical protein